VPFDNIVSRPDADPLIPEDVAGEAIAAATKQSAALALFRRLSMGSKLTRVPVLSALPVAYWVNGDTGLKQTTDSAWSGLMLEAEEIATILPVPENVVDDAEFDLWGELRPVLGEAIAATLDAAVFGGGARPASWPQAIIPAAIAAGNTTAIGTATPEEGGVVGDIDAALDDVEAGGFDATGIAAERSLRGRLRRARDASGQRLADPAGATVEGLPISYVMAGAFTTAPSNVEAVVGDFGMGIIGVRQDLRYKLLDQAVITDADGTIIYNLPQQDMVALRVTARFAYAVANPATRDGGGYPFAVLTEA
jgi:HK97 family phage major capsid protein